MRRLFGPETPWYPSFRGTPRSSGGTRAQEKKLQVAILGVGGRKFVRYGIFRGK